MSMAEEMNQQVEAKQEAPIEKEEAPQEVETKEPAEEKVEIPAAVAELLEQRKAARTAKDWAKSDELRNAIAAAGYVVKDTPQGQGIEKK
jgi:cysteinyl-tRNA synthetase